MKKTLYILRHAKAEVGAPAQEDHDRELVERGVMAAQMLGKFLAYHQIVPDKVLCSTAQRTRQTWQHIAPFYTMTPTVHYDENIYLASSNELLNIIQQTPDMVDSLLLVGHNPGVHQLCLKLAISGDDALLDELVMKFPTCTFAAINVGEIAWCDIAKAHGELQLYRIPDSL
jgi:phosphohistidine phosphatase